MEKNNIAIITYSTVTYDSNNRICVNRAIGTLLDDLAQSFNKIYFIASKAKSNSSLYDENHDSIYNYHVSSDNVEYVFIKNVEKGSLFKRILMMLSNLFLLIKKLKKVDFYYLTLPSFSNILYGLYLINKKHIVISYVGSNWEDTGPLRLNRKLYVPFSKIAFKLYLKLHNNVIKKSKFVLVTGKYLSKKYLSLNVNTHKTIPMTSFSETNMNYSRSDLNKKCNMLYVGRISHDKGFDLLIDVMDSLDNRFFLDAIGPIDDAIKEKIKLIKNNSNINIVGYVNEPEILKDYFKKADLFIFLTKGEGFPRVIYEAMLSGVPVITSDIDTIRISLEKNTALFVENNINIIVQSINKLIDDKRLYKELQSEGLRFAKNIFSITPAKQIENLINRHC